MSNLNRIVLVGTVSQKPEVKFGMENNSSLAKFTLTVERPARQDGTTDLDYIPVVAFGKAAEYSSENLKQNSMAIIEGRIQNSSFEKDGQRTWLTEVVASSVKLLGAKNSGAAPSAPIAAAPVVAANPAEGSFAEDDVPF